MGTTRKNFNSYIQYPWENTTHCSMGIALSSLLQQKPKSTRFVPEELPQDWPKYFDVFGYRSTQKGERDKNHSRFQNIYLELVYVAFFKK